MLLPLLLLQLLVHPPLSTAAVASCTTTTSFKTYHSCIPLPTQGATLAWTLHRRNSTLDLSFSGFFISPSGWVSVGFNPGTEPAMIGARALVAFADPRSGALSLLPFILDANVKLQRGPLVSRPLDIPLLASAADGSARDGGAVRIHATLGLRHNQTRIHLVWNRGLYVQGYSPTIHPMTANDLASLATVDLLSAVASDPAPTLPQWIRPLHGALNVLSWGVCLPAGAAVARYLRHCPSAGPTWFHAHAAMQIVGFLVGAVGFAMGMIMGAASRGVVHSLHRGLGEAAVAAGGLQAMALFFRPAATHRYRRYWKSYHHLVGYGCVALGVVNVFQGLDIMGLGRSYAKLAYCLTLASLLGVCFALEVNTWVIFSRKGKEDKMCGGGGARSRDGLVCVEC